MEAARPKRNRQHSKKKRQQQSQQHAEAAIDASVPSSTAAATAAAADTALNDAFDAHQQHTFFDNNSSSNFTDELLNSEATADMDPDLMEHMLAAMAADMEPTQSADVRPSAVATQHTAATAVTDHEIAQNEDDLWSLLTDAPPSAPATDDEQPQVIHAPSRAAAPSAPLLSDSDDERTAAKQPPAMRRVSLLLNAGGLVATSSPDDFPDSSPFGPRGSAVATAPPAIDLNDVSSSSNTTAASAAVAVQSTVLLPVAVAEEEAGASSDSSTAATTTASTSSAPLENEAETPAAKTSSSVSSTPSAPLMPSLSPTVSKTIARAKHAATFDDTEDDATAAVASRSAIAQILQTATRDARTTESASRVVRTTFANARLLDASRNLYPTVPTQQQQQVQRPPISDGGSPIAAAAARSLQRIHVQLEPFTNYEMNLLRAEASQKRQERKMQRIESNKGELFARLERYLFAEYLLHTAASTLEASKADVEELVNKVWTLETKRLSATQRCGDHSEMQQELAFQTAKLDASHLTKLKAHLDRLRQLRTIESSMHTLDRALAFFHIEQYLNGLLHEPNLVGFLNTMHAAACVTGNSSVASNLEVVPERISFFETLPSGNATLASTLDHLKYCIDVLVYFEKKVTLHEKGAFGRIPHTFYRGELVWHDAATGNSNSSMVVRKIKCYACGCLNAPLVPPQSCKLCERCAVVLYVPPSSVATTSREWFSSVVRFRASLQRWITTCLQSLLRTKQLSNMPFVLMHVLFLPRISCDDRSWFLRFVQFPKAVVAANGDVRHAWTDDLVDHYVAMLHLVFHPEKLRRMSVLVSSGGPLLGSAAGSSSTAAAAAPTAMNGAAATTVAVSPEWVLLENPEMLDRCFLSDADFCAVLNQFPNAFAFEQLFTVSIDTKKSFSRALTVVLELTQALQAFQEFELFPLRIAELLGELLAHASTIAASTAASDYPTLFDQLFVTALRGVLAPDCNRVAWKRLRAFPFGSLSALAQWDVLALLLFNVECVPPEAKSVTGWLAFVQRAVSGNSADSDSSTDDSDNRIAARASLYALIATDTDNAAYLLNAVAHLAASCSDEQRDLVRVAVHELFLAGYTVPACQRALGANGERAAVPISTICLAHPWIISSLLALLFTYHECAATWIHVFETFPVNRWTPTAADLVSIQEWLLLENTSAPRCALARFLLDHINWEFDSHTHALFTSAVLHRRVALIVAEAHVLYTTRRARASDAATTIVVTGSGAPQKLEVAAITQSIRRALWLDDTFDFPAWCWRLVLKLQFYTPTTHAPFLELIDLGRDRSRDALTLRRWFANVSKPVPASVQKVPFYAPAAAAATDTLLMQCVVQTNKAQLAQDVAAISSGTGLPIQEDAVIREHDVVPHDVATVAATAAQTTEPIVSYLICQLTTFVFSDRLDRWEPLLLLLKHDLFAAAVRVLENIVPVLAQLERQKKHDTNSAARFEIDARRPRPSAPDEDDAIEDDDRSIDASDNNTNADAFAAAGRTATSSCMQQVDVEVEVCMAAIETLTTNELLQFVAALFDASYINADERSRMDDVLQQGYIGGWETKAKLRVVSKLRFVHECSRFVHPALLPALINESFPRTSTTARSTTALLRGAMSWISSTLRGSSSPDDALSPTAATAATTALTQRRSSIAASASSATATATASLGLLSATTDYTQSTKALGSLIERAFARNDAVALRVTMRFWLDALLQVPFWFEHAAFRHVIDVLVRCSMARHYVALHQQQQHDSLYPSSTASTSMNDNVLLFEVVDALQTAYAALCRQLEATCDDDAASDTPPLVVSFLPPSDTTALSALFGAAFDAAQHVGGCSFLAFWSLLIETRQELPLFRALGSLLLEYAPKAMAKIEKWKQTRGKLASEFARLGLVTNNNSASFAFGHTSLDSLSQFAFYRWCEFCLEMPEADDAQLLFWQVLFALYFAAAGGGARIVGHLLLERPARRNPKRVQLRTNLQVKLRKMINYCATQAQVVLTTTSTNGLSVGTDVAGTTAAETKEQLYARFVTLSQLYTAMDAWLEEPDPNSWVKDDELVTLPRHYEVKRLQDVLRLSDVLLTVTASFDWSQLPLWTNLCGFEFAIRSTVTAATATAESDALHAMRGTSSLGLARKTSDAMDEEEFAFVEDAADLRRRHSSFGSVFGGIGSSSSSDNVIRQIQPLPLLAEHCGPSTLTMLPLVSLAVSETSCVLTPSIPLNKSALKSVAVKFSENLSVLVALDAELLDHVTQLYASKTRTVTQSIACLEGTACRQPASFRFEFMEWTLDTALLDAVQAIRTQTERCDMLAMRTNTNMAWTVMDHHDADDRALTTAAHQLSADAFLKLDSDGFMLVLQVLLIDQIVRTLDVELQNVQREQQAAAVRASTDATDATGTSSSTDVDSPTAAAAAALVATEPLTADTTSRSPASKQWDKVLDRLHEKGLEWFRLLTELDTTLSRMVPPLREVLWRSIKQLGASFVCVDERETFALLQLMLDDPSRIHLLSDCFAPAGAPTRFVEMFAKLLSASSAAKLSIDEKLVLLRRFDVGAWLAPPSPSSLRSNTTTTQPTKMDRETVLCIVLADIRTQFPADTSLVGGNTSNNTNAAAVASSRNVRDELLRFYADVVHRICSMHLVDHAETVLHALVGVHDDYRFNSSSSSTEATSSDDSAPARATLPTLSRPVDAKIWEAIVTIPLATWQRVPLTQITTFVAFLSHHMTTLRWQMTLSTSASTNTTASDKTATTTTAQYPIVYWQQLGVLKCFLDLFTICCRVTPSTEQWRLITTFFEPLLSTLYQPASTTESSSIGSPWSEHDSFSTGTAVCSCFVAACTELLRHKPSHGTSSSARLAVSTTLLDPATENAPSRNDTAAKLTQIWSFYVQTLVPHAPVHICKHLHQFLTRLAWEQWCLTLEIVQEMRDLVQLETQQLVASSTTADASSSSYPFVSWLVRDILCRMTWTATDTWLCNQSDAVTSLFLLAFAKLCVELVLDLPHFRAHERRQTTHQRALPASSNVLPPYFVNFVKQQSAFWAKWTLAPSDLDALVQFTSDAVEAPLLQSASGANFRARGAMESTHGASFPAYATPAILQDAFTRLQLVLRLLAQVTTLHHVRLTRTDALRRTDRFFRMLYALFELRVAARDDFVVSGVGGGSYATSDPTAWLVVLHSASCTVFYEKLDELVQLSRNSNNTGDNSSNLSNDARVSDDDLTTTLVGVLRFCNLPIVERFFKDAQSHRVARAKGSSPSSSSSSLNGSSSSLSWAKCGNVIFVEIDSLVRDFASANKLQLRPSSNANPTSTSDDDERSTRADANSSNRLERHHPTNAVGDRVGRVLWSFLAFRGSERCCLASCGRAIASVHVMSQVAEKSIEKWIIDDRRGAWSDLVMHLHVPELSADEFERACLAQGNLLTLQLLFLQHLKRAPVVTEALALAMLTKLIAWLEALELATMPMNALTEMKVLFLAAEVATFVLSPLTATLPMPLQKQTLRHVSDVLLAFGHARKQHGIMKAIGIGGALQYHAEFHVACLTIGVFLRLQTRTSAPLRVDDRMPLEITRTSEKHLKRLDELLQTKDCFSIAKRMDWLIAFIKSPKRSLADQDELFVSVFSRLYPSHPWLLAKCALE